MREQQRPSTALRARDVAASAAFYAGLLGFMAGAADPGADLGAHGRQAPGQMR